MLNHDVLDGEPKIHVDRNPPIKMATTAEIIIAIPCGDKHAHSVFTCPPDHGGCGAQWQQLGALRQPNLIPVELMLAHMNLVQPLNCSVSYLVEAGRLSAEARQIMTKKAIRLGAKYILYWDDDTLPNPHDLYTLYNWMRRNPHAGAVSGVYTTRETPNEPLIFTEHGRGAAWDIPLGPGAEPQPIFGAGAGFMLARIEAIVDTIEKMTAENDGVEVPIWADEYSPADPARSTRPMRWGHDVRFCNLLNTHGWPVYVHGQVLCGHLDIATGKVFRMPDDAPGWTIPRNGQVSYPATVAALPGGDPRVIEFMRKFEERDYGPINYAEIGVYEGETASRVSQMLREGSQIHLFDFEDKVPVAADKCREDVSVVQWPNSRKLYDSYNWSLDQALQAGVELDVAFLDGAHTFHHDALAFFLIDRMLKPGGYILFDDYNWSHATSPSMKPAVFPKILDQYTEEQIQDSQVKRVVDHLVKTHPNYEEVIPGFAYRKKE